MFSVSPDSLSIDTVNIISLSLITKFIQQVSYYMISSPYLVSIAYLGIERKIVDGQDNLPSLNLHFRVVLNTPCSLSKIVYLDS